jgi:hypothetical protein
MAERAQINPIVSTATRDLLRQASQERKVSQGDLVEQALLAFLRPGETASTEPLVFARLLMIEEVLGQMMGLLHALVALAEAQVKKPEPPPIATYEQMYGPLDAPPASALEDAESAAMVAPLPPARRGLRRWFRGEGTG